MPSASTLCRSESRADREIAWRLHLVLIEQFIASFRRAPKRLILDFDATDDAVHGQQEGRFFHGYHDHSCFLPLFVFCGKQLLVSYLRSSKTDAAKHAWTARSSRILVQHAAQADFAAAADRLLRLSMPNTRTLSCRPLTWWTPFSWKRSSRSLGRCA